MGGGELSGKPDEMLRGNLVMAFNSGRSSNTLGHFMPTRDQRLSGPDHYLTLKKVWSNIILDRGRAYLPTTNPNKKNIRGK